MSVGALSGIAPMTSPVAGLITSIMTPLCGAQKVPSIKLRARINGRSESGAPLCCVVQNQMSTSLPSLADPEE
jgi:hypothetical protein